MLLGYEVPYVTNRTFVHYNAFLGMGVCVYVAGGLSDEISVSGSVQDNLGKSHYKGVRFRARGISKAVHVLAVCAFYCFYISLCETWERTSAMPWRKNRNIWIDYSRF